MKSLKVIAGILLLTATAASARHDDRRTGCERGESTLKLYEKFETPFNDKYDFRVSTLEAGAAYNDDNEVLGCVMDRKPRRDDSEVKRLYECLAFDGRNYMLSTERNCEGEKRVAFLGYIYSQQEAGTMALYRCYDGYSHAAWTDSLGGQPCSGLGNAEGIIGYVLEDFSSSRRR